MVKFTQSEIHKLYHLPKRTKKKMLWTIQTRVKDAKGLVAELAPPHAQNA